jgi:hypothetical protein
MFPKGGGSFAYPDPLATPLLKHDHEKFEDGKWPKEFVIDSDSDYTQEGHIWSPPSGGLKLGQIVPIFGFWWEFKQMFTMTP